MSEKENATVDYSPLLALVLERKITLHPELHVSRVVFTADQEVRDGIRSELVFWEKGDTSTSEIATVDDEFEVSETSTRVSYYGIFVTRKNLPVVINSLRETVAKYTRDKRNCHLTSSLSRILDNMISKLNIILLALVDDNPENSFGYISNGNFIIVNPGIKTFDLVSHNGWFITIGQFDVDFKKTPTSWRFNDLLFVYGLDTTSEGPTLKGNEMVTQETNESLPLPKENLIC